MGSPVIFSVAAFILLMDVLSFQRKNGQINTLMKNHEKAFSDIKNYYNDITLNNLALINSLKVITCQSYFLYCLLFQRNCQCKQASPFECGFVKVHPFHSIPLPIYPFSTAYHPRLPILSSITEPLEYIKITCS